jgi:hypothetical protein
MDLQFDAVMILGKELRRYPERARRELAARAAGASVALRHGVPRVVALEAPLVGQDRAGSAVVCELLAELGVPADRVLRDERTRSTREEAVEARRLCLEQGWRRLLVLTAAYHGPRAFRQFEEALGPGRFALTTPSALLRGAGPAERAWIEAGEPDAQAWAEERRVERLLGAMAAGLAWLPAPLRWQVEVQAGALWRGVGEVGGLASLLDSRRAAA